MNNRNNFVILVPWVFFTQDLIVDYWYKWIDEDFFRRLEQKISRSFDQRLFVAAMRRSQRAEAKYEVVETAPTPTMPLTTGRHVNGFQLCKYIKAARRVVNRHYNVRDVGSPRDLDACINHQQSCTMRAIICTMINFGGYKHAFWSSHRFLFEKTIILNILFNGKLNRQIESR